MVFRNVGVGFSFDDFTAPVTGDEGTSVRQSDSKLVTRSGAAKSVADFDINRDLVDDGDFESGIIDIGGTSGAAIAVESSQGNSFEVQFELYDDNDNLTTTIDSTDFTVLAGTDIAEVVPVFSDRVQAVITDTSNASDNDVSGSINFNIGSPTQTTTSVSSGDVQIRGEDNDLFADEQLNNAVANTDIAQVTYPARALKSVGLDEFISRVADSGGNEVDPLTQDVTQSVSADEVRARTYGVDTTSTLQDVGVAELGNSPASTAVAQLDYVSRALVSQALDEVRAAPVDTSANQIDPREQETYESTYTSVDLNTAATTTIYSPSNGAQLGSVYLDNGGGTADLRLEVTDGTSTAVLADPSGGAAIEFTDSMYLGSSDSVQVVVETAEGSALTETAFVSFAEL